MQNKLTRRSLIAHAVCVGPTAWAFALLSGAFNRAHGFFGIFGKKQKGLQPDQNGSVTLELSNESYAALAGQGGAVKIRVKGFDRPVIVMRIGNESARALFSKCTHLNCEVALPEEDKIPCPCHGSYFNLRGEVQQGPAKKNLRAFPARVNTEQNVITVSELGEGA
ncbi:MAG: Rieske 2Fe-2S domain-containing protein [Chitinivibrionales bacterium]|nr:Rieske 2Fe-2S domain-containing protein [Chitinivibrionales bacterium]